MYLQAPGTRTWMSLGPLLCRQQGLDFTPPAERVTPYFLTPCQDFVSLDSVIFPICWL